MSKWTDWSQESPPRNAWVWAAYSLERNDWQLYRTCKNGCCVYSAFGCQVLPNFWRAATEVEGAAEQAQWDAMKPLDWFSLLSDRQS